VNPLKPLSAAFESLSLPFTLVGSLASSARGIPRSTKGVDIIVRIAPAHVDKLKAALGKEWSADKWQIRNAIRAGRDFNITHTPTGWKFDLFPAVSDFHESAMRRSTVALIVLNGDSFQCPISSPEDILLAKLRWYKDGGQVSERQWSDIGAVITISPKLDFNYLRHWAELLDILDLLEKALRDAATA